MSRDIESDYKEEYQNEEQQCQHCNSFQAGYCNELEQKVPLIAHCLPEMLRIRSRRAIFLVQRAKSIKNENRKIQKRVYHSTTF